MAQLARKDVKNPEFHKIINEHIASKLPEHVKESKELQKVFDFLRQNVKYKPDPRGMEKFQRPMVTLEDGVGDCDDYAILGGAILEILGYTALFRLIQEISETSWSHVYLLVGLPMKNPKEFIAFDPIKPGYPGKGIKEDRVAKSILVDIEGKKIKNGGMK